ncbi:hypothetical protein [Microbacterium oxydans]|uniref:Uncharacterized protein n=1 Tax=Microbacterium oxydans TaxID=82380 RepID=A0A0F0LB56_9MICO|nr:hypothetical protein [Microbacterium oxydans]KJL29540.1 hypothetical protein RS83_01557 [Microbacterium oxydans]
MSDLEETPTTVRTHVSVDDVGFLLAHGQSVDDVKAHVEQALRAGGAFVDFIAAGDRTVSVLITPSSRVVVSVTAVRPDPGAAEDDVALYGGEFDLL